MSFAGIANSLMSTFLLSYFSRSWNTPTLILQQTPLIAQ